MTATQALHALCRGATRNSPAILVAALLALAPALATQASDAPKSGYGVNPGDALHVFVWNEEDLTRELLVGPDGTISFPMVGALEVEGLTISRIGERIAAGLSNYLRDEPLVTVSLIGVEGNKIYVHGKVTRLGAYVVSSRIDVIQALALAGGLGTYAKESDIKIVRRSSSGALEAFPFDYTSFKKGEALESNILLKSGDVVVIP